MNLKRYEPKLEKDGGLGLPSLTMQESIVGSFVSYAQYEELEAQVKQLAAENAALKNWAENRAKSDDALEQERYSTLKIDYRQRLLSNIQTPATDAYADSLRAEGVEMAIEAAKPLIASEFQYSYFDACVSAAYKFPESDLVGKVGMIKWMQGFAAQLRSKSEVQHD